MSLGTLNAGTVVECNDTDSSRELRLPILKQNAQRSETSDVPRSHGTETPERVCKPRTAERVAVSDCQSPRRLVFFASASLDESRCRGCEYMQHRRRRRRGKRRSGRTLSSPSSSMVTRSVGEYPNKFYFQQILALRNSEILFLLAICFRQFNNYISLPPQSCVYCPEGRAFRVRDSRGEFDFWRADAERLAKIISESSTAFRQCPTQITSREQTAVT